MLSLLIFLLTVPDKTKQAGKPDKFFLQACSFGTSEYIAVYFDNHMQGWKVVEFLHCPFDCRTDMHREIHSLIAGAIHPGDPKDNVEIQKFFLPFKW